MVSAGDAGANNFAAFRRFIVPASRTRQFAFVHIAVAGLAGFPVPELFNVDYAQPEAAARALAENADMVLGVKVRMSENVIARHGTDWSRYSAPSRPVSCQAFLQKSCAILAVSLIGN